MTHWKTYALILLAICAAAFGINNAKAAELPEYELYPGTKIALAETLAQANMSGNETEGNAQDGKLHILAPNRFFDCDHESLSVNLWLAAKHMGSDHRKDLNDETYGTGLVYTCDKWSIGYDRMINSNRGQAGVLALLLNTRLVELGPVFLNGSVGYARVSYEVPQYNVTLHASSKVGFIGVGIKQWPRWTLNLAPVPKLAGRAWITWLKYEMIRFH